MFAGSDSDSDASEESPNDNPDDDILQKASRPLVKKPKEKKQRRNLRLEAKSLDHMIRHKDFNPHCDACVRGKTKQRPRGRKTLRKLRRIVRKFGDCITVDHVDMSTLCSTGVTGDTDALVQLDVATRFLGVGRASDKEAITTEYEMRHFVGDQQVRLVYSDNAANLKKAAKNMNIIHVFSLPEVPKSNGLIERYVQAVLVGTRVLLIQAGLPMCFWPYAAEFFAFCHNVFRERGIDDNPPAALDTFEDRTVVGEKLEVVDAG